MTARALSVPIVPLPSDSSVCGRRPAVGLADAESRVTRGPDATLSHIGCGLLRLVTGLATAGTLLLLYELLQCASLVKPLDPRAPATWLFALVGYDLLFYVAHRTSHRVALLWAVHSVHHQPNHFDLTIG